MSFLKLSLYKVFNFFYLVLRKSHRMVERQRVLKKYNVHHSVNFWETTVITGDGDISIGKGTYIGKYGFISSQSNSRVSIGRNCKISHKVHIRTSTYDVKTLSEQYPSEITSNIDIADNVWIGLNVYIKGGVTIGAGSVIGANSVVTEDVLANSVVAGVPARLIKKLN